MGGGLKAMILVHHSCHEGMLLESSCIPLQTEPCYICNLNGQQILIEPDKFNFTASGSIRIHWLSKAQRDCLCS